MSERFPAVKGTKLCAGMRSGLRHLRVPVRTEDGTKAQASASYSAERGSAFGSADAEKSWRRRRWRLRKAPHRTLAGLQGALYRFFQRALCRFLESASRYGMV
jgi:hypothetical protein